MSQPTFHTSSSPRPVRPARAIACAQAADLASRQGNWRAALESYDAAIAADADFAEAWFHRGNMLTQLQRADAALASYDAAIAIKPNFTEALFNRGVVLKNLDRIEEALTSYARVLALDTDFALAHFNRGVILQELGELGGALQSYDDALRSDRCLGRAACNRGIVLEQLGRLDAALGSFDAALAADPSVGETHFNRGNVLRKLERFDAALHSYDAAIEFRTDHAEAHYNRANVLKKLEVWDAARAGYERALALKPDYAEAHANLGNLLSDARQCGAASACYDRAIACNPDLRWVRGQRLLVRMQLADWRDFETEFEELADCTAREVPASDWTDFEQDVADLEARIARGEAASPPYHFLGVSGSAHLQRIAAETWVREQWPADSALGPSGARAAHPRIRIGYFSADFRQHPVSILAAELFESHDRARFEVTAFAFGPPSEDAMRCRLERAFERFIDVRERSDRDIALLARELHIDIAVDLGGFTQHSRPGIFALRAAPLQVSFLGYPGTCGAPYIDYLIADPTLIPEPSRAHYQEQILYLPHCALPHDSQQPIAETLPTRRQAGLPEHGFIFCCFNNVAKITPDTFSRWMRILTQVPHSILWLAATNTQAQENLRREAALRGVSPERLIFAPRLDSLPEHLARQRLADLFLDTLPYNAHSTASDALWAGLPVLTLSGESFAARVAASLLTAIELPELITHTAAHFESLAIALATHPERLARLKERLAQNRLTTPLFDAQRYRQHLELAYASIQERHHSSSSSHLMHQAALPTEPSGGCAPPAAEQPIKVACAAFHQRPHTSPPPTQPHAACDARSSTPSAERP